MVLLRSKEDTCSKLGGFLQEADARRLRLRPGLNCCCPDGRKGRVYDAEGYVVCCPRVLASKKQTSKRVWGASPHIMWLRHYGFGAAFENMLPSFRHGGEGSKVAVSARALEGRFAIVGPKYAAGRSSVFSEHYKSPNARGHAPSSPERPGLC